ncbi:MAG: T9SS type A sorting domain-containing protein [Bacteroidetes bacterium]|nr:T9SS type A sorting domain-containing protein [Bacteroidota bacterium]
MKKIIFLGMLVFVHIASALSQCTPQGDQTTYGTGNVWIGYVYQGKSFNTYAGYVNEGSASNPNFNESFGGNQVNYNTIGGCSVYTEGFSVRYKLALNYTGTYDITIGGDDGVRLSIDGGATWLINQWHDQAYTTYTATVTLSGTTDLVLEYYENTGGNQVSFSITPGCIPPADDQTIYGTGNQWIGYVYKGMGCNTYRGKVTEGGSSMNFDENFGGSSSPITYNTSGCPVQTQQFSVRYRLQRYLYAGNYVFTVGGDDGYRFSLDGGSTWVINGWQDQAYTVRTYSPTLTAGTYNMVLEYYQNAGSNRISFSASGGTLALTLVSFDGQLLLNGAVQLDWVSAMEINNKYFEVQRSSDGVHFQPITQLPSKQSGPMSTTQIDYSYTDYSPLGGLSYYRLKMEDVDGTVTYSKVIEVVNDLVQPIKIYPTVINNSSNEIFVEANKSYPNARLELFDMAGQKLSEIQWALLSGRQSVALNSNKKMAAGAYIAKISSNGSNVQSQMIIVTSN